MTIAGIPEDARIRPAARSRPDLCHFVVPLFEGRAQGKPGAGCTRSPGAKECTGGRTTGTAEQSRLSPRNGFTAYFVLSPVSGLCCHRCRPRNEAGRIDARVAAPGPHDFAVRYRRFVRRETRPALAAAIASRAQRYVTMRSVPPEGCRTVALLP